MRLTILGCSGGYPQVGEPCSGYLLETDETRLWIDAGTGTLTGLLERLDPWELDGIWISHLHPDHWTDMPIALHRMAITADRWDRPPVPVYGPPGWDRDLHVVGQRYPRDRTPYTPVELADGMSIEVGDLRVRAVAMEHSCPTFGLRAEGHAGVLGYSADTAPSEGLATVADGADVLLCEATLPADRETSISTNPAQAGRAAGVGGVGRLVLTHLLPGVDRQRSLEVARYAGPNETELARCGRVIGW